jgi:hypothetical protein
MSSAECSGRSCRCRWSDALAFNRADIYVPSILGGEFWQGEILSGMIDYRWTGPNNEAIIVDHPLAIILSADCDLAQDHDARVAENLSSDKLLPNVLLCEAFLSEDLRGANSLTSKPWADVKKNKSERYHFLAQVPPDRDLEGFGFDTLAIDFKQYFCVSVGHLLKQVGGEARRRCRLDHPFAQHLGQRFFAYQSRIGLPVEHDV